MPLSFLVSENSCTRGCWLLNLPSHGCAAAHLHAHLVAYESPLIAFRFLGVSKCKSLVPTTAGLNERVARLVVWPQQPDRQLLLRKNGPDVIPFQSRLALLT
jgi:hypothetical protein